MHVLFFKAITPPKPPADDAGSGGTAPLHERLRQLADEVQSTAGPDGTLGTDDDNTDGAAAGAAGGGDDGGADLGAPGADGDGLDDADATDPGAPGAGAGADAGAAGADAGAAGADAGAGAAFGPHNVEAGHHVAFQAGDFGGAGKVTATGDDGCTVQDKTGREHRVHWHEVKGHNDGAAAAGATPNADDQNDEESQK